LLTTTLVAYMPQKSVALAACLVGGGVYLLGTILCFWLPEPAAEDLPE
jgi:hypothetical protein